MTDMNLSRRDFARMMAGTAASAAFLQLGRSAAIATPVAGYKAMVGLFLFGGNDGWNMVVPNDARYAGYAASRGSTIALPQSSLVTLRGSGFGLHPSMAPLKSVWDDGGLGLVLNTGTLYRPLTKAQYLANPELRPTELMSHQDEQEHWQGSRAREKNFDGFMGRLNDRTAQGSIPNVISFAGSSLAVIGKSTLPLALPSSGSIVQTGSNLNGADPVVFARRNGMAAFADATGAGTITSTTGEAISSAYSIALTANGIINTATSVVDKYFINPSTGAALTTDIARQLQRTARVIEARSTLGHSRQTFFVSQGGYDNHAGQVSTDNTTGIQADNFAAVAMAIAGFYNAMKALGLSENVTLFTMSDFGRTFRPNAQRGTDHAWGNNHLVVGGALRPQMAHGAYPSTVLGGPDDFTNEGRFIPTTSQEEYIGAIAKWHGVSDADMPYVFPNWATWTTGGRGPLPLFQA